MTNQDRLSRFVFEQGAVRGELVQLGPALQSALTTQNYPEAVAALLNRTFAAVCLLSGVIKYHGATTLQLNSSGPVGLLLAQTTDELAFRGLAHWQGEGDSSEALLGPGRMQITIDQRDNKERYQSLVSFEGGELGVALENYFEQSEQLPTRFWLASDGTRAGGLMLQRMPGASDADFWEHLQILADTVTEPELLALDPETLLNRLFSEETVRLFDPATPSFSCNCSAHRSERAIRTLSYQEALELLEEQGEIEIRCEFCDACYRFGSLELERIFSAVHSNKPGALH